jgi:serine/threonine protein kinase/DNA-binding winged helix-turn-helix (wHTH) protein/class 3 adenylate cyclase/alpha-beta hydrolase superfamily lysophospholipase
MPKQARHLYEFEDYRLDPTERMLLRGGQALSLTPKAFDTLIVLVENSRHVVTKDELMSRVWPDIFVEETNLAQHISMLRKVLGERGDGGQFIETVPKRGYRFTVQVKKVRVAPTEMDFKTRASDALVRQLDTEPKVGPTLGADTIVALVDQQPESKPSIVQVGTTLGRYRILSQLGVGGMGEVYLASDTVLDRKLALKVLSEKFTGNTEWLRRFIREAKAASALNHPNIITIHEIGQSGGAYFIATEYIEGITLRQRLVGGRLKTAPAISIAVQTASALVAAHQAGILHRDIKPENIMVRPDGYVKVLDFGLAKMTGGEQRPGGPAGSYFNTDPGVVMGTVNYMSPEQARGLAVDLRSDVFSLGVVLYEMLSGRTPFEGETSSDILVSILDREPLRLSRLISDVPPELERIVSKALRKDREERYQTIKDLHLDLRSFQQDLELQAKFGDTWQFDLKGGSSEISLNSGRSSGASYEQEIPEIHYARSGEVNIAYQVVGDAPLDLVFVMGWVSHLEYFWSEPSFARFLRRLASFARVILFDKRGTGLSDRVPLDQLPTLEQRMDDVRAVMDAVGSKRAVLCGVSEGGPMCSLFAATYPEKTLALVMIGCYARRLKGEGYPWGPTEADRELFFEEIREHWGKPVGLEERAPSVARDPHFRDWWAAYLRYGASPNAAVALTRMNTEIDIRKILPTVQSPTLVIHRTGDACLKVEEGRYLAENIPGAKFVELPGVDHLPFVGDQDAILDEVEEFLTGMRHAPEFDRVLATVLVARVEGTDDAAEANGSSMDPAQRELLNRLQTFVRKEVETFKGRAIEITDERTLATFDGPARAIRAACAISDSARRLGVRLKTGLHTGECDSLGDQVRGLAVDLADQVSAQSNFGEVLVSSTVKDLVAGSGIRFHERGVFSPLENLGELKLFGVERGAAV